MLKRIKNTVIIKSAFLITLLILSVVPAFSQSNFTISGTVKDSLTGETLIGASVSVAELKGAGSISNAYGFYSLTVPSGKYTITAKMLGYNAKSVTVNLLQNTILNFTMASASTQLHEV